MPTVQEVISSLQERLKTIETLFERLKQGVPLGGPITSRFLDIARLTSLATGWSFVTFQGTVSSSSITQPTDVNVPTDRDFFWWGFSGYHDQPGDNLGDTVRTTFDLKEDGNTLFVNDFNMAALVTTIGRSEPFRAPENGGKKIRRGARMSIEFKRASGWVGGTRTFGVILWGDLLR